MRPITTIIDEQTGWLESGVIALAKANYVDVRQEGKLILLNYLDDLPNDVWNDFNRQCRGLILNLATKSIVAHPYNKFFNLDRHPETQFVKLPFSSGYEIAIKYDGTMVTAYAHNGRVKFATRSTFRSEHTEMAEALFKDRYPRLQEVNLDIYTLVFELICPDSGLTVEYDDTDLILIGVRGLTSNEMFTYSHTIEFAESYGLRSVSLSEKDFFSALRLAKQGTNKVIEEGWVVRFKTGLYVKLKTWQYLAVRHIQRLGLTRKLLTDTYLRMNPQEWSGHVDSLPEPVRARVREFGRELQQKIDVFCNEMSALYNVYSHIESRKDFALAIKKDVPPDIHCFLFALLAGEELEPIVRKQWKKLWENEKSSEVIQPSMIKEWAFAQKD